jgi:hypothetical protein
VIVDTDHLWGIGGDAAWVERMFQLGYQVLYMDPLDDDPVREEARRAMGRLVVPQGDQRIDARRPPGRDVAGDQ